MRLPAGLPSAARAEGWIVELDGRGVGYEEAVPCPMCNMALIRCGLARVHYSSHAGVVTEALRPNPAMACAALDNALRRVYPKSTVDPGPMPPPEPEAPADPAAAEGGGGDQPACKPADHEPTA